MTDEIQSNPTLVTKADALSELQFSLLLKKWSD